MKLFPAIDLYGGKAVRLLRGDYDRMTVYSDDPPALARDFRAKGATCLHTVDLEGARDGSMPNLDTVRRLAGEGLFTEVGGGIRSMEAVERYLEAGVNRVILGTAAVTDPDFTARAAALYGDKIAVGIDIRDGMAAIRGWTETGSVTAEELLGRMRALGITTFICTAISRDGAMQGPDFDLYRRLSAADGEARFIASGGVSSLEDIRRLRDMGLYGVIVGKAYYTGAVDLAAAAALCAETDEEEGRV